MIHSTIGVYANGDRKHNGVAPEDLQGHIAYNKKLRPGRALFVDGKCVHKGYLSDEIVTEIEKELAANPRVPTEVSKIYH